MNQIDISGCVTGDYTTQSAVIHRLEVGQWFALLDVICPIDAPGFIPTGITRNLPGLDYQYQASIPREAL